MNIIATFPDGLDQVTVNGLHQWDWGRNLEIHDANLPELVEVHFACPGMPDAVVRSCAVVSGVAVAAIPDACIEQTAPIVAWVVAIGETSGETIRTITLPIIPRTRPEPSATIPANISDKYTEAVAAMNAAVEQIKAGNVTVATAKYAESAGMAETAGSAMSSGTADDAKRAAYAGTAGEADVLSVTDSSTTQGFTDVTYDDDTQVHESISGGIYIVRVRNNTTEEQTRCSFLFEFNGYATTYSAPFQYDSGKEVVTAVVKAEPVTDDPGYVVLRIVAQPLSTETEKTGFTISVRRISEAYGVG